MRKFATANLAAKWPGQPLKYTDAEPLRLAGYAGMKQREKTIPLPEMIRVADVLQRSLQLDKAIKATS